MVKIDISEKEIQALDKVLVKIKADIQTGYLIALFRIRLQQKLNIDLERRKKLQAEKILGVSDDKSKYDGNSVERSKRNS